MFRSQIPLYLEKVGKKQEVDVLMEEHVTSIVKEVLGTLLNLSVTAAEHRRSYCVSPSDMEYALLLSFK